MKVFTLQRLCNSKLAESLCCHLSLIVWKSSTDHEHLSTVALSASKAPHPDLLGGL